MSSNENTSYPLISIGVSAYNRKDYLKLCLDSLLAQTYPNFEIIVIDDGSTDGTDKMMAECYPGITYVRQENGGDASAKNHAARIAKGEYIVFCDSDYLFYPDSVMRLYQAMPVDGNACVYGTYQDISSSGKELRTRRKMERYPSGRITRYLLRHVIVNSCGTLMPRKMFLAEGGFDTSVSVMYYYRFFLELALKCEFYAIQKPVFMRRRHHARRSASRYRKLRAASCIFENFAAKHPELEPHYTKIIRSRRADLQNRLCREAGKEKKRLEKALHAREFYHLKPGVGSFFRLLISAIFAK